MKRLYAFDFDGTLTTHDTLLAFIRYACGTKAFILMERQNNGSLPISFKDGAKRPFWTHAKGLPRNGTTCSVRKRKLNWIA